MPPDIVLTLSNIPGFAGDHQFNLDIDSGDFPTSSSLQFTALAEASDVFVFRDDLIVCRGKLVTPEGRPHNVVCKLATAEASSRRVKHEAEIYIGKLKHLQGTVIPHFWGLFRCRESSALEGVLCFLVDHKGRVANLGGRDWTEVEGIRLTTDVCKKLVNLLVTIHFAGVCHNDFFPRNIIVQGSEESGLGFTMIDFDHAYGKHACPLNIKNLEESYGGIAPVDGKYVACHEIFEVCRQTGLWIPNHLVLFEKTIPVEAFKSLCTLHKHLCEIHEWTALRDRENALEAAMFIQGFHTTWERELRKLGWVDLLIEENEKDAV